MTDVVFTADPTRLIISAGVGIVLLLFLIIKFKLHPVISMMISAIVIGIGAGMPLNLIRSEKSRPSFRTYRTCNWYNCFL